MLLDLPYVWVVIETSTTVAKGHQGIDTTLRQRQHVQTSKSCPQAEICSFGAKIPRALQMSPVYKTGTTCVCLQQVLHEVSGKLGTGLNFCSLHLMLTA